MLEINLNLISITNFLGFFQGTILGVLLLYLHKSSNTSYRYISLFVLCFALGNLFDALAHTGHYIPNIVRQIVQSVTITAFLFPLFYYYVKQVSILSSTIHHRLLYFPLIMVVLQALLVCLSSALSNAVYSLLTLGIDVGLSLYGLGVGVCTVVLILNHKKVLLNQYASLQKKELNWALLYVSLGILFELISAISYYFNLEIVNQTLLTIINVGLLYWVSIRVVLQQNVLSLYKNPLQELQKTYGNTQELQREQFNELLNLIDKKMISTELFKQQNLSIIDVAELVSVHPRKVSQALNTVRKQNFNTYINAYRIEKAKMLLKSDVSNRLSIEGIGFEVGFQSKSTFYAAFKKYVGTTPTAFKQSINHSCP